MTRVALIDGPLPAGLWGCVELLCASGEAAIDSPAGRHAAAVASAIQAGTPGVEIISIPVFLGGLSARVESLVAAFGMAATSGANIVHCSLGLARNDPRVAKAVEALAGKVIVASAPARGDPIWPAALPSVLSVQGDARCGHGEWSVLDLPTADFGACPHAPNAYGAAGASIAAANLTGILAKCSDADEETARAFLRSAPKYQGREMRSVFLIDS